MNVAALLEANLVINGDALAVVDRNRRYSYAQICGLASQVANGLAANGYGVGDRIALCCSNKVEFITAYFGILKTGATVVALNTALTQADLVRRLNDSEAVGMICYDGTYGATFIETVNEAAAQAPKCRNLWIIESEGSPHILPPPCRPFTELLAHQYPFFSNFPCDEDQTAMIAYSSGTTGDPKGIEITHGNILSMVTLNEPIAPMEMSAVRLVISPLFHIMAQTSGMVLPLAWGQKVVLMEKFDPALAWHLIDEENVTYLAGPPILFRTLMDNAPPDAEVVGRRTLKLCISGAAPLPEEWSEEFESRFGVPILPAYGATETTATVTLRTAGDPAARGTVGRPIAGVEIRIVDRDGNELPAGVEGEILIRSPGIMKGYWKQPDVTDAVIEDGWYHSGDIGCLDERGYLTWLRRMDRQIVRRTGTVVSPARIENILLGHPRVSRAVVLGVPNGGTNQALVAFLEVPTEAPLARDDFLQWLSTRLAAFEMPDDFSFLRAFPVTETGKIARQVLIESAYQ